MKVYNRYASSLFELSKEAGNIDKISEEILSVSKIFSENAELFDVLKSPNINNADKFAILEKIFKSKVDELIYNFILVLVDKKRIDVFFEIKDEFTEILNDYNKQIKATIKTATDIDEETKEKLINKVKSLTNTDVMPTFIIDPSILGGVIISYENTLIDGSIKTKLLNLNKHIGK